MYTRMYNAMNTRMCNTINIEYYITQYRIQGIAECTSFHYTLYIRLSDVLS